MTRPDLHAVLAEHTLILQQSRLAQSRVVQLIATTRHLVRAGQQSCERTRQVLAASRRPAL